MEQAISPASDKNEQLNAELWQPLRLAMPDICSLDCFAESSEEDQAAPNTSQSVVKNSASALLQRMAAAANNKLPGQHLFVDFISEEEEAELIDHIEHCEPAWHLSTFNGSHR